MIYSGELEVSVQTGNEKAATIGYRRLLKTLAKIQPNKSLRNLRRKANHLLITRGLTFAPRVHPDDVRLWNSVVYTLISKYLPDQKMENITATMSKKRRISYEGRRMLAGQSDEGNSAWLVHLLIYILVCLVSPCSCRRTLIAGQITNHRDLNLICNVPRGK